MDSTHAAGTDRTPQLSAARIDVAAVIDAAPLGALQRRVFGLCFLVSMLDGFDTQSIAFVAPSVSAQWHLPAASFGPIFSATLLGSVVGASIFGRLADRYGRRLFTVLTVALFGVATLICAFARDRTDLLICRLIAGIGLGGAIPNFMALAAEYAPKHLRSRIVVMTLWGFPLGAVVGGLLSTALIRNFGWPSVFITGGVLPLLLIPVLIAWLPESIRFLALRRAGREALCTVLGRIDTSRTFDARHDYVASESTAATSGAFRMLFTEGRAASTLLLSTAMFMSLLLSYMLINWIPLLLQQAGLPSGNAVLGAVALNLAGIIGSYFFSRRIDQTPRPITVMVTAYVLSAFAIVMIGRIGTSFGPIMATIFITGFLLIGVQMTMSAFSANAYPTSLRGTGIGFIQSIGRIGSLLGPLAAGALLSFGMTPSQLFHAAGIPALLAAASLLLLGWFRQSQNQGGTLTTARHQGPV